MSSRLLRARAHEIDAAWIIALWIQIHDGDPPPEGEISGEVIELAERLAARLSETVEVTVEPEELEERLIGFGFRVADAGAPGCCVGIGGHLVCVREGGIVVRPHTAES